MAKASITISHVQCRLSMRILVAAILGLVLAAGHVSAQDIRTQELLLDDDAPTTTTRNTITFRGPLDDSLSTNYILRFPNTTGLGTGSLPYVDTYTSPLATLRWLAPRPNSILTSDVSGLPVWADPASIASSSEWIDGDSIGISGIIYAVQALGIGTADTVVITDGGRLGLGTTIPDGLITMQGENNLFTAKDLGGTLRSSLNDDGEQNWYLGNETGEMGRARVGSTSGFASFSLFRPSNADRFDILNRSTYVAMGFNADGADTGSTFNIEQGGNVGIGIGDPTTKLHIRSATDPLRLEGLVQDPSLDSVLVVDGQGVVHWAQINSITTTEVDSILNSNAWLLLGNGGTVDGTNFLGTLDSVPLNFRVNNARAFRIEPTLSNPNIIGGPTSNSVVSAVGVTISGGASHTGIAGDYGTVGGGFGNALTGDYAVVGGGTANDVSGDSASIGGGGLNTISARGGTIAGGSRGTVSANYGAIGGGRGNTVSGTDGTVGGGELNTASGSDATVAGGEDNTASGDISTVGGGDENTASGYGATVSGGESGAASGNYAVLGGGEDNLASAHYSTVAGGWGDTASGYASAIGGGEKNVASGSRAVVGGGELNNASGSRAVIAGGERNLASDGYATIGGGLSDTASGYASTVGGGEYNVVSGSRGTIAGGGENLAAGNYGAIGGGMNNEIQSSATFSAIPGGRGLTLSGSGSFGFLGNNNAGTNDMSVSASNTALFGNTALWLANNNNTASQLRFYEPNPTTGTFPGTANYSSFAARAQSGDINYILPDTAGIAGDVLGIQSVAGNTITLDWTAGSGGGGSGTAWLLTGNSGTNASTNFLGTTDNVAFNIRVNNQRALRIDPRSASPNITGGYSGNYISTSDDGNVIAGGGSSGALNQINGSDYGFIGGGRSNQVNTASDYSSVVGGSGNGVFSSDYALVGGGQNNQVNTAADYSSVVGGSSNGLYSSDYGIIGGGQSNQLTSSSDYSSLLGGSSNGIHSSDYGFIGGGQSNQLNSSSDYSSVVGGTSNGINGSDYGFIGGGQSNQLNSASDYSSVIGGTSNAINSSDYGFIGGGQSNQLNTASDRSVLVGGQSNQISSSDYGFIGGGQSNQLNSTSDHSVLVGGLSNQLTSSTYSGIVSGRSLTIGSGSDYGFIGGGQSSQISSSDWGVIAGGSSNQISGGSDYTLIGSGANNQLSSGSDYSSIVAGRNNQIDNGQYSLVGAGNGNRLTSGSNYSAIFSGSSNQIDAGDYSFIGGGTSNSMTSLTDYAVIVGGQSNTMNSSANSYIGGGESNSMNGAEHSVLVGGRSNAVTGDYAAMGGGRDNNVSANYSVVPGGRGLTLSGSGSFGFLGNNIGSNNMTVSANNVSVLGNTDLWMANNDNSASQVRFYEPNSSTGTFPSGTNYTSLRAQAQAQDIEYIFPDTAGVVGDILAVQSISGNQVTLDWRTTNEAGVIGRLLFARKTADETVSTATLQNDDHLQLALEAGRTYEISGALYVKRSTSNGQFDLAWDVPTGATMLISFFANESKSGNSNTGADIRDQDGVGALNNTAYSSIGISTSWNVVHFKGLVVMGTTAGDIKLMWAPVTGTATVYTNSYMGAKIAEN